MSDEARRNLLGGLTTTSVPSARRTFGLCTVFVIEWSDDDDDGDNDDVSYSLILKRTWLGFVSADIFDNRLLFDVIVDFDNDLI